MTRVPSSARRPARRVVALSVAAGVLSGSLAGCVSVPSAGPVVPRTDAVATDAPPGAYVDPSPPQPGDSAAEVVEGFLEAMKATPVKTSVAQLYLTAEAQRTWQPELGVRTYASASAPQGELEVEVELEDVNEFDERGAWQRTVDEQTLALSLTTEGGEWRIDGLPDALIVPDSLFRDWFRRVNLYFLDPSGQVLVPEPVFAPLGQQFATSLVRGLLQEGTARPELSRTAFPPGIASPLSVPISEAGVAQVGLNGEPGSIDETSVREMLAQLTWTLRQDERVKQVQLSLGEAGQVLPGGSVRVGLDAGAAYDPNGAGSSVDLFGLLGGRLVRGTLASLAPTSGPLGRDALGVEAVGVSLDGSRVAAVSQDAATVLLAPTEGEGEAVPVLSGVRPLPPVWDVGGRLWVVDRPDGARVTVIVDGQARTVAVPGLTGRDVRRVLVSRDGTRLVAVVRGEAGGGSGGEAGGESGDELLVSRILHDQQGRVLRATRARSVSFGDVVPVTVRDIGWRSPTTLAVLTDVTDDLSQVRTLSVDGAPSTLSASTVSRVRGQGRELISSPIEGEPVYVIAADRSVTDVTAPQRPLVPVPDDLRSVGYVG